MTQPVQPAEHSAGVGPTRLSLAKKIAFLGACLAALVVIGEFALWAAGYEPRVAHPPSPQRDLQGDRSVKTSNPDIPYLRLPHSSFSERWPSDPRGYFDNQNHEIRYRVNRAGFRGRDFAKESGGAVRLAFLGDSFCWGVGVKEEDHFLARLSERLAAVPPFDGPFELLNFGLEGYNTKQEVALFKEVVLDYRPQVAVIWYFLNDWEYERGLAGSKRYLRGNTLWRWPRRYSRLLDWAISPLDLRRSTARLIQVYRSGYEEGNPGWEEVRGALEEFAGLCREHGMVPMLAIHPVLIRLDEGYPFAELHRQVFDFATRQGIYAVDLLPAVLGHEARGLWVHPIDQHPNELAHRMVADRFFGFLIRVLKENESAIRGHMERR